MGSPRCNRSIEEGNIGSNDMALITLDRVVSLTGTIIPICLPSPGQIQRLLSVKNMFVTGWGKLSRSIKSSDVLQQLQAKIVPQSTCNSKWHRTLPNNVVCVT